MITSVFACRFVQVMNQPMARSEQPPANETYYCPYANEAQAPQKLAQKLPATKSADDFPSVQRPTGLKHLFLTTDK